MLEDLVTLIVGCVGGILSSMPIAGKHNTEQMRNRNKCRCLGVVMHRLYRQTLMKWKYWTHLSTGPTSVVVLTRGLQGHFHSTRIVVIGAAAGEAM